MRNFPAPLLLIKRMLKATLFLWLCVSSAQAEVYYPTADASWQTTTAAAAGADPVLLAEALTYAKQANSDSLVILHGGRILAEQYTGGSSRTTTTKLYSASKAMVAALLGKLQSIGEFTSLEQKSSVFIPEWQGIAGKQDITLRHHLTMTTGLKGGEQNLVLGTIVRNERNFAINLPLEHAPGTYWTYNNPAYRLLFSIIESATGDTLPNVSAQHLFTPLGMSAASWEVRTTTIAGNTILNYQWVAANALSAARFGLLALRGGVWNGTQVIPAAALSGATISSQNINPSYGQLWWLNNGAIGGGHQQLFDGELRAGPYFPEAPPDLFAAIGKDDQIIACIPSLDLVIVRQGKQPLGAGSEAISADQNVLFGKIARAFGYAGQTQPYDLTIAPISGGARLSLLTWFGRSYHIEQSPDLGATPWSNATASPLTGNGLPATFDHVTTELRNFYRGRVVR